MKRLLLILSTLIIGLTLSCAKPPGRKVQNLAPVTVYALSDYQTAQMRVPFKISVPSYYPDGQKPALLFGVQPLEQIGRFLVSTYFNNPRGVGDPELRLMQVNVSNEPPHVGTSKVEINGIAIFLSPERIEEIVMSDPRDRAIRIEAFWRLNEMYFHLTSYVFGRDEVLKVIGSMLA